MSDYPWMIAEIGVNWRDLDDACEMIRMARVAGFQFAKFQLFDDGVIARSPEALRPELKRRKLGYLEMRHLNSIGREVGLPVFYTAMYPNAFYEIRKAGGHSMVKVRLADQHNVELWQACARDWRGMILYSTDNPEVEYSHPRVPLYCVGKYPATAEEYEPMFCRDLRGRMGASVHAPDPDLVKRLMLSEAMVVEVHVRKDGDTDCLDAAVSFEMLQIEGVIREVRHADASVVRQHPGEQTVVQHEEVDSVPPRPKRWDIFKKRGNRGRAESGEERAPAPGNGGGVPDRG